MRHLAVLMSAAACACGACKTQTAARAPSVSEHLTWDAPVELARGGGHKGPWQQHRSQFDYVDDATVALADDGAAAVAWVDHRSRDVLFQYVEPSGAMRFGAPVNVSRTPAMFSWLPRIVIDGRDVFVLWQEIVFSGGSHGGDILFARSTDGGRTFDPPQNLSRSMPGDGKGRLTAKIWSNGSLDLARDASGALLAAWTEYDGPLWLARSDDRGETWSTPAQIAGTPQRPARAPAIATTPSRSSSNAKSSSGGVAGGTALPDERDAQPWPGTRAPTAFAFPEGAAHGNASPIARSTAAITTPRPDAETAARVYLAWTTGEDEAADIVVAASRDGGRTFGTPTVVAKTTGYSDAPKLAVDGSGVLHVVFADSPGFQAPAQIYYVRSHDQGRSFSRPVELSRMEGIESASFPSLVVDETDRIHVLWDVQRDEREPPRGLAIVHSRDRGSTFTPPALIPGSLDPDGGPSGSHQGRLMERLHVRDGAIVVGTSALRHGSHSRVWIVRGRLRDGR